MNEKSVEMSKKVTELVQSGMSMEEALQKILEEAMPAKTTGASRIQMTGSERVNWISSLSNLEELKKAIKVAFAKKSKAKSADKPETIARYEEEIEAGKARLNELIAEINKSADPIATALKYGESVSGIIQLILDNKEAGLDDKMSVIQSNLKKTNKEFKDMVNATPTETPASVLAKLGELGPEYIKLYEERATKGDQRILTLNKRLNLLAKESARMTTEEKVAPAPAPEETKVPEAGPVNDQSPAEPVKEPESKNGKKHHNK
jgi:hypothetical protein